MLLVAYAVAPGSSSTPCLSGAVTLVSVAGLPDALMAVVQSCLRTGPLAVKSMRDATTMCLAQAPARAFRGLLCLCKQVVLFLSTFVFWS